MWKAVFIGNPCTRECVLVHLQVAELKNKNPEL